MKIQVTNWNHQVDSPFLLVSCCLLWWFASTETSMIILHTPNVLTETNWTTHSNLYIVWIWAASGHCDIVVFLIWLCVFIIHCKYPICHHLIDVHLYKFFTCLDINKICLNHCDIANRILVKGTAQHVNHAYPGLKERVWCRCDTKMNDLIKRRWHGGQHRNSYTTVCARLNLPFHVRWCTTHGEEHIELFSTFCSFRIKVLHNEPENNTDTFVNLIISNGAHINRTVLMKSFSFQT